MDLGRAREVILWTLSNVKNIPPMDRFMLLNLANKRPEGFTEAELLLCLKCTVLQHKHFSEAIKSSPADPALERALRLSASIQYDLVAHMRSKGMAVQYAG